MKKLFLIISVILVVMVSCKKEEQTLTKQQIIPINNQPSNSTVVNEKKFSKEIIVSDESKQNTAFYRIWSDDEKILADYLNAVEFKLNTTNKSIIEPTGDVPLLKDKNQPDLANYDLTQKPQITIELVNTNLQNNVKSYSLEITKTAKDYLIGYPIDYITSRPFIGIVHTGNGYPILARFEKRDTWHTGWSYYGSNFFLYPTSYFNYPYYNTMTGGDLYRRGVIVWPDRRQTSQNYTYSFWENELRGRDCTIGWYDGSNCGVGTPPSGTTAFIYANYFYYTPISGNQCPYPGSWFDGANCAVRSIPSNCSPFIWANNWYVKPDLL